MTRYLVAEDVHVEHNDAMHGTIEADFKAGEVSPQSENEEVALRKLVEIGQANVIEETVEAPKDKRKGS